MSIITDRLLANLRRISARERALVALLVLIASSFALMEARDWEGSAASAALSAAYARSEADRRLAHMSSDTTMEKLAAGVEKAAAGAFEGQTHSIAGVAAQTALGRMLSGAGLAGFRIQAEGEPTGEGRLRLQSYRIQSPYTPEGLAGFLDALLRTDKVVSITALSVNNGPAATFTVKLTVILSDGGRPDG